MSDALDRTTDELYDYVSLCHEQNEQIYELQHEIAKLEVALKESRENDRIAMSWIGDFLKAANFNGTYPEFVEWIEARHKGE